MELKGKKVIHQSLGIGIIAEQTNDYIAVEFSAKTSKFVYPGAFIKFIKAQDSQLQAAILSEYEDVRIAAEAKKQADDAAREAAEELKALAAASKKIPAKQSERKTAYEKQSRDSSGRPMVFFVFQGNTFDKENRGGYIWAPITNKAGSTIHHWDRLLEVRKGDIIIHGCDGYIAAISTARGECYECAQPDELRVEDLWDKDGRRVDCEYITIKSPIKTSNYKEDIINLSATKYSPFNKDGDGNMGYLFEINPDLARIFIRETARLNDYLLNYEFVNDFLNNK